MMTNDDAPHFCLLSCIAGLLAIGAFSACMKDAAPVDRVEYRIAVIEDDQLVPHGGECEIKVGGAFTYIYPSGREQRVRASRDADFALNLDSSVFVSIVDYGEIEPGTGEVFSADIGVPEGRLTEARKFRESHLRCDLLISIGGEVVGVERRGRFWRNRLPGGTFSSREAANARYSGTGVSLAYELAPAHDREILQKYWAWRRLRDLWEFRCDPAVREEIRRSDPDAFDALTRLGSPETDCENPPEYSEDDAPEE